MSLVNITVGVRDLLALPVKVGFSKTWKLLDEGAEQKTVQLVINTILKPFPGVNEFIHNAPREKVRVCLLGDYHIDATMVGKRQKHVQMWESQMPKGLTGRIVLLEGVESRQNAANSACSVQFMGCKISSSSVEIVGCDSSVFLAQTGQLLKEMLEARRKISKLQADLIFARLYEEDESDGDDGIDLPLPQQSVAELQQAIAEKKELIEKNFSMIKLLGSERSKIMAETVQYYLEQNPDAFIYLAAGNAHIEDLVKEEFGLAAKQVPFSAVLFEKDESYNNCDWKDVAKFYQL